MVRPPHPPFRWTVALLAAASALLALTAALSAQWDIPLGTFMHDLASVTEVHPMTGVISNLGVLGWTTTAVVCGFTALILDRRSDPELWAFFVASSAWSTVLLLDDFFMLHDFPFPIVQGQETIVLAAYLLVSLAYVAHFRTTLATFDLRPLGLAVAFFALSIFVDQAVKSDADWRLMLEDGPKFLGIAAWTAFYVGAAVTTVRRAREPVREVVGSA